MSFPWEGKHDYRNGKKLPQLATKPEVQPLWFKHIDTTKPIKKIVNPKAASGKWSKLNSDIKITNKRTGEITVAKNPNRR